MSFKYKAFISYSHKDSKWAEWLLKKLEGYKIPKHLVGTDTPEGPVPARLAPIFRDRDELPAADSLSSRLNEAIAASEYMIVICSPTAAKSRLVNKEIVEFKRVHGESKILALVVGGETFSKVPDNECFPPALMKKYSEQAGRADFSAEGIAADVRPGGDGQRSSLLKIVAGIIGVGLDALVRREERRRQKRMAGALAASVAVTLITGGLAYEAHTARVAADVSAQQAQERMEQSLRLTSFLMSTVYEELLGVGNLQSLEIIVNKVAEFYRSWSMETISSADFFQYSGAVMRLGQMYDRRGESEKARKLFEDILPLVRSFYKQNPKDENIIFRLQNTLFFVGYMAKRQGRYEEAKAAYRERLQLAKIGLGLFPDGSYLNRKAIRPGIWQAKVAEAEGALAEMLYGPTRHVEEAIDLAKSSVAMHKTLLEQFPNDVRRPVNLGSGYQQLGDIYRTSGQLTKAMQTFRDRLAVFDTALDKASGHDYRLMRRRYTSLQNVGHIQMDQGHFSQAAATYQEAADGFDILTAKDPKNTLWLAGSAELYADLAAAQGRAGDTLTARKTLAVARSHSDEAMRRDNSRVRRQITALEITLLEAELATDDENTAQAIEKLEALSASLDNTLLRAAGGLALYGRTHLLIGEMRSQQGQPDIANAHWNQIVDTYGKTQAVVTPNAKACLASAYKYLGKHGLAAELEAELQQQGFASSIDATVQNRL